MECFEYVVPTRWDGAPWAKGSHPTEWLGASPGELVTEAGDAARFRHKLFTSSAEDLKIELELDRVNGGISGTMDLSIGLTNTIRAIRSACTAVLIERGQYTVERLAEIQRAEDDRSDAKVELDQAIEAVAEEARKLEEPPDHTTASYAVWRATRALARMQMLQERQVLAASWTVTWASGPDGWREFADLRCSSAIKAAIQEAHVRARQAAMEASGN